MSEYYSDVIQRKSKSARREGEPTRRKQVCAEKECRTDSLRT